MEAFMKLFSLLDLNMGDMVSIVGAGGKTTLMFRIAEELRRDYKCLVTTTTKIFVPDMEAFDFMAVGSNDFRQLREIRKSGIYVYGSGINEEKKLLGISLEMLDREFSYFDFTIVEADGSKRKPVKGWNEGEPVISSRTSRTIGVLSIEALGKVVNDNNVHRVKEFLNITGLEENGIISIEALAGMVFHPKGLFKGSAGERILFIIKLKIMSRKFFQRNCCII
jgi:probable selenium-dependent hydroxylase accessory protein YqeC